MEYAYKYDMQFGTSKDVPWTKEGNPKPETYDPLERALVPKGVKERKDIKAEHFDSTNKYIRWGEKYGPWKMGGGDNGGNIYPMFGFVRPVENYPCATPGMADGLKYNASAFGGFPYEHPDGVTFDGWQPPMTLQNMVLPKADEGEKTRVHF